MINIHKAFGVLLVLLLAVTGSFAQPYGNEWINPLQQYFKMAIPETGIYRVSRQALEQAGVPVNSFSAQNVQLFYKGKEIPCYIKGENTGIIEYIEFYAAHNDGWFDSGLYEDPEQHTNKYYSQVNDTASVFLTWNSSFSNSRYQVVNNQNFSGKTPLPFVYNDKVALYNSYYNQDDQSSYYTSAQGFMDASNQWITLSRKVTKTIETPNLYPSGQATIEFALGTLSRYRHHLLIQGGGINLDTLFFGITGIHKTLTVNAGSLSETNNFTFETIDDQNVLTDKSSLNFIRVKYPMLSKFEGQGRKGISLSATVSDSYLKIENFASVPEVVVLDYTNGNKIIPKITGTTLEAIVPKSTKERTLYMAAEDSVLKPEYIKAAPITNYGLKQRDYVIISNKLLWESATEYAEYRNALLIDADELYNQFAYGIGKHPLAIRKFLEFVSNNWSAPPKFLLFLGKGMVVADIRKNSSNYSRCMIPTLGDPGSDVQYSANLFKESYASNIATGRIAANNNLQVSQYLNKVKQFEENEPSEWMKHIMHFGGGGDTPEQQTFARYLDGYEEIAEDSLFGGHVYNFFKTNSDPLTVTKSDTITSLMNSGVSLITFFGHGNVYGFDQNIDEPEAFRNIGKYPLLIANSCYTGNIHVPSNHSNSENWVLINEKGAIGFLAMSFQGIDYLLNYYTTLFYQTLFQDHYGVSIGEATSIAGEAMLEKYGTQNTRVNTVHQFTLHGDPAIVLNTFNKPDILLNEQSISFLPKELTTSIDSFEVLIVPCNIGKTIHTPFNISLKRTYPDGSVFDTVVFIQELKYKDTLSIKLPIDISISKGPNLFEFRADGMGTIDELNEQNNHTSTQVIIKSNELTPLMPYKNSLMPVGDFRLKASSGDVFSGTQAVLIELDTSYLFSNPISEELVYEGGILEWSPPIQIKENTTYFWRIAELSEDKEPIWTSSAFEFLSEKKGWKQATFGQQSKNQLSFIEPNTNGEGFKFVITPKKLFCRNIGSAWGNEQWFSVYFTLQGDGNGSGCGASPAIHVVVVDTLHLEPWKTDRANYGHKNYPYCPVGNTSPFKYFSFPSNNTGVGNVVNFIENHVPDGYHVLVYTFIGGNFTSWNEANRAYFESMGANVRNLSDKVAYIFYTQKGDISTVQEKVGADDNDMITFSMDLSGNFTFGSMRSEIIGPAIRWNNLTWNAHSSEGVDEYYHVSIYGLDQGKKKTLLQDSVLVGEMDLSSINPLKYPYLQLEFFTNDEEYLTPAVLDFWQVDFEPVSDLALNPNKGWAASNDTLQEGDKGYFSMSIENIGFEGYDSIPVRYWIQNAKNELITIEERKLAPLAAGASVQDTVFYETLYLPGFNAIWMEINGEENSRSSVLNEQYSFNNIVQKSFYVERDQANPFLDVTFDGIRIMDGDIVSPTPEIVLQLTDENPYLALNDTAVFSVYLKSQKTGIEEKLDISSNPQMFYEPGTLPENKARLVYSPIFEDDGVYELRVQAKDVSGNSSGDLDYVISFQVILESTITHIFNYPNPFSTSTRFVFELTGEQLPDELRIDIFTGRKIGDLFR